MSGKAGHPAYFDPQTEKAFMKQGAVFANKKELLNKGNKKAPRYVTLCIYKTALSEYLQATGAVVAGILLEGECRPAAGARKRKLEAQVPRKRGGNREDFWHAYPGFCACVRSLMGHGPSPPV